MQIIKANFDETAPAKASQSGQIFVATGTNVIGVRFPTFNTVSTSETTSSTSYTDLATGGPAITVTTGARYLLLYGCLLQNDTTGANAYMSYDCPGASVTAADAQAFQHRGNAGDAMRATVSHFVGTATPGSNTFTARYRVSSGTGTFQDRRMQIIPF